MSQDGGAVVRQIKNPYIVLAFPLERIDYPGQWTEYWFLRWEEDGKQTEMHLRDPWGSLLQFDIECDRDLAVKAAEHFLNTNSKGWKSIELAFQNDERHQVARQARLRAGTNLVLRTC